MSDEKFTEGEWWVADCTTNGVKGYEICWSPHGECVTDHVYEEADAHLMSASKDMYEALVSIDFDDGAIAEALGSDMQDKIIAALAKARGETK